MVEIIYVSEFRDAVKPICLQYGLMPSYGGHPYSENTDGCQYVLIANLKRSWQKAGFGLPQDRVEEWEESINVEVRYQKHIVTISVYGEKNVGVASSLVESLKDGLTSKFPDLKIFVDVSSNIKYRDNSSERGCGGSTHI